MGIDLNELGRKLRNLRKDILKLPLEEVASRTGIELAFLERMEAGSVEPTGDQILILSDIYNEPFLYFITYEKSPAIERATELYRMHGDQFSASDRRYVQEFLHLCRMEHEFETMLGGRPRTREYLPTAEKRYKKGHGYENAERLRIQLRLGMGPVDNAFHLVRQLGCHVFRRKLGNSSISGIFIRHPDIGKCILVNYDEDIYRQKFSVLHELCHALLDGDFQVNVTFKNDLESGDRVDERDAWREWRANAFAGRLLIPLQVIQAVQLGSSLDEKADAILKVCTAYKANFDVGLIAFRDAKRISQPEYKSLIKKRKIGREAKVDPEIEGEPALVQNRRRYILERGLSPAYVSTCFEAYRQGLISIGKLADALLSRVDELDLISTTYGERLWGTHDS